MRRAHIWFGALLMTSLAAAKVTSMFYVDITDTLRLRGGTDDAALRGLRPVDFVDLERFMGHWFEVGRLDNSHQRGQVGNTGCYTMVQTGKDIVIEAKHKYRSQTLDSKELESIATAWPTSDSNYQNSVWWFSLMTIIRFRFVIIGLDPNYEWCVAGNPRRQSLWVMSRRPTMTPALWNHVVGIAASNGFDTRRLKRTLQPGPTLIPGPSRCPTLRIPVEWSAGTAGAGAAASTLAAGGLIASASRLITVYLPAGLIVAAAGAGAHVGTWCAGGNGRLRGAAAVAGRGALRAIGSFASLCLRAGTRGVAATAAGDTAGIPAAAAAAAAAARAQRGRMAAVSGASGARLRRGGLSGLGRAATVIRSLLLRDASP